MKRLGAVVPVLDPSLTTHDLVRMAAFVEEQGYDAAFMPEAWSRDAICILTAFACATERIEIGTAAISLPVRSHATVGMAAATIDDLSDGRFILGIGMGHERTTTRWHGLPYEPSLQWMREYVEVIRRIHRREVMSFEGERVRSTHYRLGFEPRRKHVPIWIAVLKPGMMRLAGEIADGMLMYFSPLAYVGVGVEAVAEGLAKAGRARGSFDLGLMIPTCVTDEPAAARAVARRQVAWYSNLPFYNDMFAIAGFETEAGQLRDAWAEIRERDPEGNAWTQLDTGGTEQYVSDEMADAVVVIGDADHCAARIEEYAAAGVDTPIVFPFGGYEPGGSWDGFTHTLAEIRKAYA